MSKADETAERRLTHEVLEMADAEAYGEAWKKRNTRKAMLAIE